MRAGLVPVLVAALLATPGCFLSIFAPDTHDDMRARHDAMALPGEFRFVQEDAGGIRAPFAGPNPHVTRTYIAPWVDGALCDEVEELAADLGGEAPVPGARNSEEICAFDTRIGAGWSARFVGVWSYRVWLRAMSPQISRGRKSDAECRDELRRLGSQANANPGLLSRECHLEPGDAFVMVRVSGRKAE